MPFLTAPTLAHYLVLGAVLFAISVAGIFLNRKNVLILLMAIELMLLAVNLNFVAFARYVPGFRLEGQVFAVLVIVLAAAEAAVALAIFLNFYNNHGTVDVDEAKELKG